MLPRIEDIIYSTGGIFNGCNPIVIVRNIAQEFSFDMGYVPNQDSLF